MSYYSQLDMIRITKRQFFYRSKRSAGQISCKAARWQWRRRW